MAKKEDEKSAKTFAESCCIAAVEATDDQCEADENGRGVGAFMTEAQEYDYQPGVPLYSSCHCSAPQASATRPL